MSNKEVSYLGKNYWDVDNIMSVSAERYHNADIICSPYENNPIDITIFVSSYNEELFIQDTLDVIVKAMAIVNKTYEIIIIDDGSKDRSVELIKDYIQSNPEINILLRINKKNKGLAQNYIDGAFIGRGKFYRLICGDNAEPLETIVAVMKMIGKADIIVPYYTSAQGRSLFRVVVSRMYTFIINLISGNKLHYYNGLHVHLRHNVMRWHPNTRGFGFQAGLLCILLGMGFSHKEVPCVTIERRSGQGNAITWKNLRSVMHTICSILVRRIAPWIQK